MPSPLFPCLKNPRSVSGFPGHALDKALPLIEPFLPDLILYQAGVDGLACDSLGRLSLTHKGLVARDERVMALASAQGIPLVGVLGGGYSRPIDDTVTAYCNTFRVALSVYGKDRPVPGG